MNYFPTKILLATDASKDAVKAAQIATSISSVSGWQSSRPLRRKHEGLPCRPECGAEFLPPQPFLG